MDNLKQKLWLALPGGLRRVLVLILLYTASLRLVGSYSPYGLYSRNPKATRISDVDLSGVQIGTLNLKDFIFTRVSLKNARFTTLQLTGCRFFECDLRRSSISGSFLYQVSVSNCDVRDMTFCKNLCVRLELDSCDLSNAYAQEVLFNSSYITNSKLFAAIFSSVSGALEFSKCILLETNFLGSDLRNFCFAHQSEVKDLLFRNCDGNSLQVWSFSLGNYYVNWWVDEEGALKASVGCTTLSLSQWEQLTLEEAEDISDEYEFCEKVWPNKDRLIELVQAFPPTPISTLTEDNGT